MMMVVMMMKWNDWCFRSRFCDVRLYWVGGDDDDDDNDDEDDDLVPAASYYIWCNSDYNLA